mmetsp:Transcript_48351/g.113149  ORF Transcript_48351/g.113149 Transcript_48351/m.113149 type:complete len:208 (-) Transcript_48351:481-1104(-)
MRSGTAAVAILNEALDDLFLLWVVREQVAHSCRDILDRLRDAGQNIADHVVGKVNRINWGQTRSSDRLEDGDFVPIPADSGGCQRADYSEQQQNQWIKHEVEGRSLVEAIASPNRRQNFPLVVHDIHSENQNPYRRQRGCTREEEFRSHAAAGIHVQDEEMVDIPLVANLRHSAHAPQDQEVGKHNPEDWDGRQEICLGEGLRALFR